MDVSPVSLLAAPTTNNNPQIERGGPKIPHLTLMRDRLNGLEYDRALDKWEYLMIIRDNFSYFSLKPYVVTPHLNRLDMFMQN